MDNKTYRNIQIAAAHSKKSVLLVYADKVINTGLVSISYVLEAGEKVYHDFQPESGGPYGYMFDDGHEMGGLIFNLFRGVHGLFMGGAFYEDEANKEADVWGKVPEYFSLLCTTDIANRFKKMAGDKINIREFYCSFPLHTSK